MDVVAFFQNNLEGTLPNILHNLPQLQLLRAGETWMEGAVPRKLAVQQPKLAFISMKSLHLESSLPQSLRRISAMNASLVFGHGHDGPMPAPASTLLILSAFANVLEGHLPGLRMANWSALVVHSNLLSCMLPSSLGRDIRPPLALALLGNSFQKPRSSYPEWVQSFERGDFFIVSNDGAMAMLLKVVVGVASIFAIAAWKAVQYHYVMKVDFFLSRADTHAKARKAFYKSARAAAANGLLGCVVVLTYLREPTHACETVLARLRLPVLSGQSGRSIFFEIVATAHIMCGILRLYRSSQSQRMKAMRKQQTAAFKLESAAAGWDRRSYLWTGWLALCCGVSTPSAIYSMLRTIPGLLGRGRGVSFLLKNLISLFTSILTSFCLPKLAKRLQQDGASSEELVSVGNLIALPLIPFLTTFIFNVQCLGQWARIWQPCLQSSSPLDDLEHVRLPYFGDSFIDDISDEDARFHEVLLGRRQLCSRGHMSYGRCVDAILERSAQ